MKLNIVDRVLAEVAPQRAAARLHARAKIQALAAMPDFGGMSALDERNAPPAPGGGFFSRRWGSTPRDARADTLPYLRTERGQSRELARTSPIAVGAINTNVDRVVGTGMALSAQPNLSVLDWTPEQGLAWKRKVQTEFSLWADSPESDIAQQLNFYQQQGLVLRSTLESGDTFTVLPDGTRTATQPYALRIQLLEADRVGNPNNAPDQPQYAGGVKFDDGGAPSGYFIYDRHPGGLYAPGQSGDLYKGRFVERLGRSGRRRILHHFRKLRPDQPRGLTYLAPIIDAIKQISRYTEAEIMAAVITAYFTVFIETPTGASAPVFDGSAPNGGSPGNEIELGMGMVVGLAPGEKPHTANPARPNPNFEPFITAVIKQMGMALSIPFELLMKQFNASYSASKAALLDAWVYFRSVRNWLALSFCQPVYETWLAEAVAIGRIAAPGFFTDPLMRWAYTRALWPGDSMGSINPKDEIAGYAMAVDARLITLERAEWELFGTDFNDTFDVKAAEQQRLKDAGMQPVPRAGAARAPGSGSDNADPSTPPNPEDQP
jgi:lambda family phage portal protein